MLRGVDGVVGEGVAVYDVEAGVFGSLLPEPRLLPRAPHVNHPAVEPGQGPFPRGSHRDAVHQGNERFRVVVDATLAPLAVAARDHRAAIKPQREVSLGEPRPRFGPIRAELTRGVGVGERALEVGRVELHARAGSVAVEHAVDVACRLSLARMERLGVQLRGEVEVAASHGFVALVLKPNQRVRRVQPIGRERGLGRRVRRHLAASRLERLDLLVLVFGVDAPGPRRGVSLLDRGLDFRDGLASGLLDDGLDRYGRRGRGRIALTVARPLGRLRIDDGRRDFVREGHAERLGLDHLIAPSELRLGSLEPLLQLGPAPGLRPSRLESVLHARHFRCERFSSPATHEMSNSRLGPGAFGPRFYMRMMRLLAGLRRPCALGVTDGASSWFDFFFSMIPCLTVNAYESGRRGSGGQKYRGDPIQTDQ